MVKLISLFLVAATMLFNVNTALADNKTFLKLTLAHNAIEAGEFTLATLSYRGPDKLADINLAPWLEQVEIIPFDEFIESGDKENHQQPVQIMQLRLYPRQQGTLSLAAIQLGRLSTAASNINVRAPVVDKFTVKLGWSISNNNPWQREAVLIRFQVTTNDYAAHIMIDPIDSVDPIYRRAFQSRVLPVQVTQQGKRFIHRGGWLVQARKHGDNVLQLPPVRYRLSGSDQRRFYLPRIKLKVQPLPSYLPPTLPVGKLQVSSTISSTGNQPATWEINISGPALLRNGLSGVDTTLSRLSQQPLSAIAFKSNDEIGADSTFSQVSYHAPLPAWLWPYWPSQSAYQLRLRYFDPQRGKIVEMQHQLATQLRMPRWAWLLLSFIGLLILAYGIYRLWPHWQTWKQQRDHIAKIQRLDTPIKIRRHLIKHGQFISLHTWAKNNPARCRFAEKLNATCFGRKNTSVAALKIEAVRLI